MTQQHFVVLLDTNGDTIKTVNNTPILDWSEACLMAGMLNERLAFANKFQNYGGYEVVTETVEE